MVTATPIERGYCLLCHVPIYTVGSWWYHEGTNLRPCSTDVATPGGTPA